MPLPPQNPGGWGPRHGLPAPRAGAQQVCTGKPLPRGEGGAGAGPVVEPLPPHAASTTVPRGQDPGRHPTATGTHGRPPRSQRPDSLQAGALTLGQPRPSPRRRQATSQAGVSDSEAEPSPGLETGGEGEGRPQAIRVPRKVKADPQRRRGSWFPVTLSFPKHSHAVTPRPPLLAQGPREQGQLRPGGWAAADRSQPTASRGN